MHPTPLIEPDRFFAGPPSRTAAPRTARVDPQTSAVERLVARCEALRPHLRSVDALDAFIRRHRDPARLRKRISIALALEASSDDLAYGLSGRAELEAFRRIAEQRTAAVVWVFA